MEKAAEVLPAASDTSSSMPQVLPWTARQVKQKIHSYQWVSGPRLYLLLRRHVTQATGKPPFGTNLLILRAYSPCTPVVPSSPLWRSISRQRATFALCSSRVRAKAWPPVPSATKKR